jgi:hypothetical protein
LAVHENVEYILIEDIRALVVIVDDLISLQKIIKKIKANLAAHIVEVW